MRLNCVGDGVGEWRRRAWTGTAWMTLGECSHGVGQAWLILGKKGRCGRTKTASLPAICGNGGSGAVGIFD